MIARRSLAALLVVLAASCSFDVYRVEVSEMLYFGTANKDGTAVSDDDWQRFLATEVSTRFPDGFTTWDANGQWRTREGAIQHERTHIVQIIHGQSPTAEGHVRAIVDAYKRAFPQQETVLRVRTHAGVAFQ